MKNYMKKWTKDEDERLKQLVGTCDFKKIARLLGRTEKSVESRLERIKYIKPSAAQGYLTASQLAKLLQVDVHTVLLWIEKYKLPHARKVVRRTREYIYIDSVRFWRWASNNKNRINFSKIPQDTVVPEPLWVQQERIRDGEKIAKRTQQLWTKTEDAQLIQLRNEGYTQEETGRKMGRSRIAIQRREQKIKSIEQGPFITPTITKTF